MKPKLLLATTNVGKIKEMRALLQTLPLEILTPADLGLTLEVQESGATYEENASLKARAYAQASGLVCLADDSGLEVAALGGAPGLHSARYVSSPDATDADRRSYLIEQLRDHPRPWNARFFCLVAIATAAGNIFKTEGVCAGEIIPVARGQGGFGYDPIFLLPAFNQTMAELDPDQKNELSHRGRAVKAAIPMLRTLLNLSSGK
jgi:XTP/dITP diphosphohydrolase